MNVEAFDVVLSFDTTNSMSACLDAVRDRMSDIIRKLKKDIPGIKLGVIAHGDYDTSDTYVIKFENLTDDVERLCRFVKSAEKTSGYTWDEAYELALHYARCRMDWRPDSNRVLVMIGDCNPHEKYFAMNTQRIDWEEEIRKLRDMNVKINAVQCLERRGSDAFYNKIASTTFGHHVPLRDFKEIEKVIMLICYREAGLGLNVCGNQHPPNKTLQTQNIEILPGPDVAKVEVETDSDSEEEENQNGMICRMCKTVKPPNEFPSAAVTKECRHAPLECLRCVVKHVNEEKKCPREGCIVDVDPECKMMKLYQAKLDKMFVDYKKIALLQAEILRPSGEVVSVSTISGDTEMFKFNASMKVIDLKKEIGRKLNLKTEQQKLFYNDTILKSDGRLSDYCIGPNANISLILPLFCVPEHLDHVVFDLSWVFPSVNPDFLDATCMAFERNEFVQVIDWTHPTNTYYLQDSVRHSEKNLTGPGAKTGHQTIHVYLKRVPGNITHLYFTLSSWRSPNLSAFHNPSLKFYEASSQNINLCETTFTHALNSQAVIMCYAVRVGTTWQIYECVAGSLVAGNSKCYNPIRARIADLIKREQ